MKYWIYEFFLVLPSFILYATKVDSIWLYLYSIVLATGLAVALSTRD